jgi:hypothetical protein
MLKLKNVVYVSALALVVVSGMAQAPAATPAPEDELIFTNGDKLSGKLTRVTGDSVLFHSDMAGDVTVSMGKVRELHTQGVFAVLRHGETMSESRKAVPGKLDVAGASVVVTPKNDAAPQIVPVKDVQYAIDEATFSKDITHKATMLDGWNGSVNVGAGLSQATTHGGSITGGIALVRQIPVLSFFPVRDKTILNFQENYGVLTTPGFLSGGAINPSTGKPDDVQAKTSIMHADAERDEYLSANFYGLATTAFDHNYSQSLDLQQIYGGGIGWTPVKTPKRQLDLKTDVHYEKQHFFGGVGDQNLIGSSFSENFRQTLPLKMTLTQTLALLPAWNNLNAYSGNGGVTLVAPLFRRLSINFTTTDSFINNPVPGYQKNSFTFTTGLTYTLR